MPAWVHCRLWGDQCPGDMLEDGWRTPRVRTEVDIFHSVHKRMQKSTLHLDAYSTIQTVTAFDAEVRESLFRTCTALLEKPHYKDCIENWP